MQFFYCKSLPNGCPHKDQPRQNTEAVCYTKIPETRLISMQMTDPINVGRIAARAA